MPDTPEDLRIRVRRLGTPDPRLTDALDRENDPGVSALGRANAVGEIAREAGWPAESPERSRDAATAAMQRLEGSDFSLRGRVRWRQRREAAAYESRRRGMVTTTRGGLLPAEEPDTGGWRADDGPATIFDE
jgi:hypothetical protein